MPSQKKRREDDILPYRHLNISAYPDPIQSFNSSFFTLHYYLFTCCCCERKSSFAPPLPLSKTSALPNLPKTFFSLRRQAKLHAEGASLSACGKHHSPKANSIVQPPRRLNPMPPSGREGDREAVEGASGYESNGLPCMRYSPLFF